MATETEPIKPYQGPPPSKDNFAQAFPELEQKVMKGVNLLDPESLANLEALRAQMRSNPAKPATIVNLHPWPLTFGAINPLMRGITIPACAPAQAFAHAYIRVWRHDKYLNENGSYNYRPILPIQIAAEFVREFSNRDNDGGGVIIFEGDTNPDKVKEVELYDPMGRPMTTPHRTFDEDEEGNRVPVTAFLPVKGDFQKVLREAIAVRNQVYLRKVQQADHDYNLPDGRGRRNIHDKHLLMAEVLFADGLISSMPKWNLTTRLEDGFEEGNCPACGTPKRQKAFKCGSCGHVLDPLEAYRNGAIEYGHLSMEMLTVDEMEQADEIRAEREATRRKFQAKQEKANKGKGASEKAPAQGEKKD